MGGKHAEGRRAGPARRGRQAEPLHALHSIPVSSGPTQQVLSGLGVGQAGRQARQGGTQALPKGQLYQTHLPARR